MKINTPILIALMLACSGLCMQTRAVNPPPDGGYSNFNTAEGQNALLHLTTGVANTANGWFSLTSNTDGSFNTGVGAGTLTLNVGNQSTGDGVDNTAVGAAALFLNISGSDNTAVGTAALLNNDGDTTRPLEHSHLIRTPPAPATQPSVSARSGTTSPARLMPSLPD
jgi:hypothetical protein